MSAAILSRAPAGTIAASTISGLGILVMTTIHHGYGAWIFDTPWRLHIVFISIPAAIAMLGAIPIGRMRDGSLTSHIASWLYITLTAGFAIAAVGIYEGGYNHLLPNILYVLGIDHPLRESLYAPPDDLTFQLTGTAQFVIAILAAWYLWRLVRAGWRGGASYSGGMA